MEIYDADDHGTHRHVSVGIGIDGDLMIETQDLGSAPRLAFGTSEYEFAVSVEPKDFAALLVKLVAKRYAGDASAADHFRGWLDENQIPNSFWNRMGD